MKHLIVLALLTACIGCTSWGGAMVSPVTGKTGEYYITKTSTFLFWSSHTIVKVRALDEGELKGRFVVVCNATPPLTAAGIKAQAVRARNKATYYKKEGYDKRHRLWMKRYETLKRLYTDITKKDADIQEKPEPAEPEPEDPAEEEEEPEEPAEDESGWGD